MLRVPEMADFAAWSELRLASRDFLAPWEPQWSAADLTRTAFRLRVKRCLREIDEDTGYPFFIFSADGRVLLGGLGLSNLRRGVAQMASLGYWIGKPYARRGYMTEAVRCAATFAFEHAGLHRLEAACLPSNEASRSVLTRCGFREEGIARRYLRINGDWQDHLLFGYLRDDEPLRVDA